ncbi:MAG: acyl-CoA dehydrogenase family protein [Steroidobacteraceae bacterium]
MDYALNEDQAALVAALQALLQDHAQIPQSARSSYCYFDAELQQQLEAAGFLAARRMLGSLEAALVVIETARVPVMVETGASTLVAPELLDEALAGPIALVSGKALHKAHRNLAIARTALIERDDHVLVLPVSAQDVETVSSIYAYPFGRFRQHVDLNKGRRLDGAAVNTLKQWWRVALAAEMAGAAQAAVAFTVDYVKQRSVFGRPVGSFQSVQHRLAQCHQIARAMNFMALKAAWSRDPRDADLAACYAQHNVPKVLFDLHQFNGAMGITNEHLLHFWTYRLRALQSEAGGVYDAALDIATRLWGSPKAAIAERALKG